MSVYAYLDGFFCRSLVKLLEKKKTGNDDKTEDKKDCSPLAQAGGVFRYLSQTGVPHSARATGASAAPPDDAVRGAGFAPLLMKLCGIALVVSFGGGFGAATASI